MTTYTIPAHLLEKINIRIHTLNTRAARHGHAPFVLSVMREVQKPTEEAGVFTAWVEVSLSGEAAWAEGWRLAARLEHQDGQTVVFSSPLGVALPVSVRDGKDICEHCGTNRNRLDTFVIVRDGEFKRVGRNCLADFCGTSPAALLAQMEGWEELERELEAMEREPNDWLETPASAGHFVFSTLRVMELACASVRVKGWCSKAQAEGTRKVTTVSRVLDALTIRAAYIEEENIIRVTAADTERAKLVIDWAAALGGDNPAALSDYEHNLKTICGLGVVTYKGLGFAVSAVAAYERHMGQVAAHEKVKGSQHFGVVGQRGEFILQCYDSVVMPGYMGGTIELYKLQDANGNQAIWKCSSSTGLEKGVTYKLTARVDEHGQYREVNQTKLSRVKVLEVLGRP